MGLHKFRFGIAVQPGEHHGSVAPFAAQDKLEGGDYSMRERERERNLSAAAAEKRSLPLRQMFNSIMGGGRNGAV